MTVSSSTEESLVHGHTGRQLVLVTTGTLTFTTGRFVIPPLLPTMVDKLSISNFEAGIALSLMFGLTALFRYPGGRLSDDLTRKTVLVSGLGVAATGFVVLTAVNNYGIFLLSMIATGIGVGLYTAAAVAKLSDIFVERRGQALGINNSSIYVAGVLGAVIANAVLDLGEWRTAFLPIAGMLLVLLLAFDRWTYEPYLISWPRFDLRETLVRIFFTSRVRRMLIVGALFSIGYQGVTTFLPAFLQSEKAFPAVLASNLFALLFIVGIGANLVGGQFADRYNVPYVVAGVASLATVGLVAVIFAESTLVIVLAIIVLGAGIAAVWPALQSYMMQLSPEDSKGGDYGAFSAVYSGIGSVGPGVIGFIIDQFSYVTAFMTLAVCFLASALFAVRFARL